MSTSLLARRPSKYTDEFKRDAVDLVRGGCALNVAEKDAEIARLRAEVAEPRTAKEILRKAAAR